MFGDRPFVHLPGGERGRHVDRALEIDRKRQRVHHGASAALSDVRRQRVRGVPDDRHPPRRPAAELDQIEAIVTALLADAVDQRLEVGKPRLPRIFSDRRRLGDLVAVEHRERDIDVALAAGRIEHAPGAGPIFDGGGAVRRCQALLLRLGDQQARRAIDQVFALSQQADGVAHR